LTLVRAMIPADCYALRAPAILKTFEIRPARAAFSCFAGPKVMLFHASMKAGLFDPGIIIIYSVFLSTYGVVLSSLGISFFRFMKLPTYYK